ncbi:hypothetical protein IAU60_000321 [Kwoniella sp. DSM 27419]
MASKLLRRGLSYPLAVIAYPLFILLHLSFVLFSLLLRTCEAFSDPLRSADDDDSDEVTQKSSDTNGQQLKPPRHLGLVLVPSASHGTAKRNERAALVESVRRAVAWADERGIPEVSVWDGHGLTQSALPTLMDHLSPRLPPSPPSSTPSTPPSDPTQDDDPLHTAHSPPSPSPLRKRGAVMRPGPKSDRPGSVISLTAWPRELSPTSVQVLFLPPSSSAPTITSLTKRYAQSDLDQDQITVARVDADIRDQLRFAHDPDLLLIHHLSSPSLRSRLLPRRAPELWGYPFWALRITEIYQYPTPLPIPSILSSLAATLRSSSLPFVRKIGYTLSLPPPLPSDGSLARVEWDGAMRAWSRVEQRLGR